MIIRNKTHYFSEYTKLFNAVPDPDSFQCQASRRMGFYQRLWFEYHYTLKVNGIAFYYTLTYNDLHIPKFKGRNCFSYKDIRYITNGKLSKILLRKYGSRLRYFCACESGSGGTEEHHDRGLGNNPHYHFIFFVQPLHNEENQPIYDGYTKITSKEFKDIIYSLWQGKPSDVFVWWQNAKYGHCQEGLFDGVVQSAEAFKYCGKYVVKDTEEKYFEDQLREAFFMEAKIADIHNGVLYDYYKFLKATELGYDKYQFFRDLKIHDYYRWRKDNGLYDKSLERYLVDYCGVAGQAQHLQLTSWFYDYYIPWYVECRLSEYRNNWSPKCRMSKSLGEYGLNFIMYVDGSPRLVMHTSTGYDVQYPCLYYIRKLFYDVRKCPITGNPLYYLNDFGRKCKLDSLDANIKAFAAKLKENFKFYNDNNLHLSLSDSDKEFEYLLDAILDGKKYTPSYVDTVLQDLSSRTDLDEIIRRYAVYHFIYQYRHQPYSNPVQLDERCLPAAYLNDYEFFLRQNSYFLDYESCTVYDMIYKSSDVRSFKNHPAFQPYFTYFKWLDKMTSLVDSLRSDDKKSLFSSSADLQSRHKSAEYNDLYRMCVSDDLKQVVYPL